VATPHEQLFPQDEKVRQKETAELAAISANNRLFLLFHTPDTRKNPEATLDANEKMLAAVRAYFDFTIQGAAEGLRGDGLQQFVKEKMVRNVVVHPFDAERADIEFEIISQGYQLNRNLWDAQLAQRRRLRSDIFIHREDMNWK